MKVKRKCKKCGKIFFTYIYQAKTGSGKYCSNKCKLSDKRIYKKRDIYVERKCENCGNIFYVSINNKKSNRRKYCSLKCRDRRVIVKCKNCGKEFKVSAYRIKDGTGIFCSRKCTNFQTEHICILCGKKYKEYRYKTKTTKYCSRKCQYKDYSLKRIKKECIYCGKKFLVKPSNKSQKFDSKECQIKYNANPPQEVKCLFCREKFFVTAVRLKNKLGKYCSRKCHQLHRHETNGFYRKCNRCKKEYWISNADNKYGIRAKFCSKKCYCKAGSKYPIEIRKKVKKESSNLCASLGKGKKTILVRKTFAIRRALNQGILNKNLLNHIKKGATYEAYI